MKKKLIITFVIIAIILGVKKFTESNFFVEKMLYSTVQHHTEKKFLDGEALTISSTQLDSIWHEGVNKVLLLPASPTAECSKELESLLTNSTTLYNNTSSFAILPVNNKLSAPLLEQYQIPSFSFRAKEIDFLFLNSNENRVLVANIKREINGDKYSYIFTIDKSTVKE